MFPACSCWFKEFHKGTVFHSITKSLQEGIVSLSLHCCYPPPCLILFTLSHSVLKILKEFDLRAEEVKTVDQSECLDSAQNPSRGLTFNLHCDVRGKGE